MLALLGINLQHGFQHTHHLGRGERRPHHLAGLGTATQRRAIRAAQGHLVPLLAVFIDTQNTNVAAVVVAAGVDAAADVQINFTQVKEFIQVLVALRNGGSHRQGTGIGQVTVVAAWAGDHVGQHADIGFGQAQGFGLLV